MTSHGGPEVARRRLAQELRALRTRSVMPVLAVARALRCSTAKIRHLETGRNPPNWTDLEALLRLYGATSQLDHFDGQLAAACETGWWDEYRLSPIVREYIGLEDAASLVRRFTLELVPGMLQTEAYSRKTGRPGVMTQDEEDRYVTARLRRGDRLQRGEVTLSAVMSQALLCRTTSMGDVGTEQLQQLHNATTMPNVTLRVLPFDVGTLREMRGNFTIFAFPVDLLEPIAHQELASGDVITENTGIAKKLQDRYNTLRALALSDDESAGLIERFINQIRVGKHDKSGCCVENVNLHRTRGG